MKTIKDWQDLNEVVNRGLRDIFTGIDPELLDKKEFRRELKEYQRKAKFVKEYMSQLYKSVVAGTQKQTKEKS